MRRRDRERVGEALRSVDPPDARAAEERGWLVVREAFAEREPLPRRLGTRARAGLALAGAGAVAALALTPAGAEVREWLANAIDTGEEDARPGLGSLPAAGSVLIESGDGVWIVRKDGSRRRLGPYERATWSANGLFVGASAGRELVALTPQGEVRWALTAPGRIRALDWSSDEGVRVAYVSGGQLRVVAGDGTGDRELTGALGSAAIAWRPESLPDEARHELAYADRADRVVLRNTDSGGVLWRSAPVPAPVERLQWSADGERLLVAADGFATLLDSRGEGAFKGPVASGTTATLSPSGRAVASIRASAEGAELTLRRIGAAAGGERRLYPAARSVAATSFGSPAFSPDGEWILLPWPAARQWIFVRVADRRVIPIDVSRLFDPSESGGSARARLAGWCC